MPAAQFTFEMIVEGASVNSGIFSTIYVRDPLLSLGSNKTILPYNLREYERSLSYLNKTHSDGIRAETQILNMQLFCKHERPFVWRDLLTHHRKKKQLGRSSQPPPRPSGEPFHGEAFSWDNLPLILGQVWYMLRPGSLLI